MDNGASPLPLGTVPAYFELSWSILSSIGIFAAIASILVVNITHLSPLLAVPLVVSTASSLSNGLCYYAFYSNYSTKNRVAAGVFADLFWLVQEAGLSFYSYQILVRALQHRSRIIYLLIFWILMTAVVGIRIGIMTSRAQSLLHGSDMVQHLIDHLHMGYFITIALLEILGSSFLIKLFHDTNRSLLDYMPTRSIFQQLMRTTEIRLATLALIGIGRSITYSFQTTPQTATTVASQFDRFMYTMECLFPFVMLIDVLASKIYRLPDPNHSDFIRIRDGPRSSVLNVQRRNFRTATAEQPPDILSGNTLYLLKPRPTFGQNSEIG